LRADNHAQNPFPTKRKGKNKKPDFRSAAFANNRRNARQMPTRQLNRGR
jgi:hypothetical protein